MLKVLYCLHLTEMLPLQCAACNLIFVSWLFGIVYISIFGIVYISISRFEKRNQGDVELENCSSCTCDYRSIRKHNKEVG